MSKSARAIVSSALSLLLAVSGVPAAALAEVRSEAQEVAEYAAEQLVSEETSETDETDGELEPALDSPAEEKIVKTSELAVLGSTSGTATAADDVTEGWMSYEDTCEYKIDDSGNMVLRPRSGKQYAILGIFHNFSFQGESFEDITSFSIEGEITISTPGEGCTASIYGAFKNCKSLISADLSGLRSQRAVSAISMFSGCTSLISVKMASSLPLYSAAYMFDGCAALHDFSWSGTMSEPYDWDRISLEGMFRGCSSLVSADLSKVVIKEEAASFASMFDGCTSLLEVIMPATGYGYNTKYKASSMAGMFKGCTSLTSVSNLDRMDSGSCLKDTSSMFENCVSLEELWLEFSTSSVTSSDSMFKGCFPTTVHVGSSFSLSLPSDPSVWGTPSPYTGTYIQDGSTYTAQKCVVSAYFNVDDEGLSYTGKALEPLVSSYLFSAAEYDVAYKNNVDAGTAIAVITGKGSCVGTCEIQFSISPKSINRASVTASDQKYTGLPLTPPPVVTLGSKRLTYGTDYSVEYQDNVELGLATLIVHGEGNYGGSVGATFTIVAGFLSNAKITIPSQVYIGADLTPEIEVLLDDKDLVLERDYKVAFANNINAGWGTATITGINDYGGTVSTQFAIAPASLSSAVMDIDDQVYSGDEVKPSFNVVADGVTLKEAIDYEVSYRNNIDSGIATAVVTGKGNFFDTASVDFVISRASLSNAEAIIPDQTYSGFALEPDPSVVFNDKTLVNGKDYTVTYSANVEPGKACAYIEGVGNLTGVIECTFNIDIAPIDEAEVIVADQVYGGSALEPAPVVVLGGNALVAGADYDVSYADNVDAGTASVTVTGKGNYSGQASGTFVIRPADISGAAVSVSPQTFTGSELTPAPTVTLGESTLSPGSDYDVSYSGNVDAGTATVTVSGKGNYSGTVSAQFEIAPKAADGVEVSAIPDQVYIGSALEPELHVAHDGAALVAGSDYDVFYAANVNVGTATATVTCKGNYTGKASKEFQIKPASLSAAVVEVDSQLYTGQELKPVPVVTLGGEALVVDVDFDVDYDGNVEAGQATATVTGRGNYTGSAQTTFSIMRSISDATVEVEAQVYTGSALEPAPVVTLDGKTLSAGTDYEVSYENNVDVGTATVIVTGKGSYTGETKATFRICPYSMGEVNAYTRQKYYVYRGSAIEPVVSCIYWGDGGKHMAPMLEGRDFTVAYADNDGVGTGRAVLTGIGDYAGTYTVEFPIVEKIDLSTAQYDYRFESYNTEYFYTGQAICPKVERMQHGSQFIEGRDYEVTYESNVEPGTATAVLKGIGDYTGEMRMDFSIVERGSLSVSGASVWLSGAAAYVGDEDVYLLQGGRAEPTVTVCVTNSRGQIYLIEGVDYQVSYRNSTYTGTATVTVRGINGISGSISKSYKVVSSVNVSDMSLYTEQIEYELPGDGSAVEPKLIESVDGFTEGEGYWLEYSGCDALGTGKVIVHGKGRFTGTKEIEVPIVAELSRPSLLDCDVADVPDQVYTGSAIKPSLSVRDEARGIDLEASYDYSVVYRDNVNVGTASASLRRGPYYAGYDGCVNVAFNIVARDVSDGSVTVDEIGEQEAGAEPEPVVRFNGRALVRGADYEVSYSGNDKAGIATATISGKGNFAGTRTVGFKVKGGDGAGGAVASDGTFSGSYAAAGAESLWSFESDGKRAATIKLETSSDMVTMSVVDSAGATAHVDGDASKGELRTYRSVGGGATTLVLYCGALPKGTYYVKLKPAPAASGKTYSGTVTFAEPAAGKVTMYRLYNKYTGEHFYTGDAGERDNLRNVGWTYEGVGWTAPSSSATPVYRLYNSYVPGGDHHYTTSKKERDDCVKAGWTDEGIGWYSDDAKGTPLYRQYNPYAVTGTHNYTTDKKENDYLVSLGWRAEGISWYGVK